VRLTRPVLPSCCVWWLLKASCRRTDRRPHEARKLAATICSFVAQAASATQQACAPPPPRGGGGGGGGQHTISLRAVPWCVHTCRAEWRSLWCAMVAPAARPAFSLLAIDCTRDASTKAGVCA
jgi:hypothetical protein